MISYIRWEYVLKIQYSDPKKNKQLDPLKCLWTQPGVMRAKGLSPGNCLWYLRDPFLAPVWPWGRDPASTVALSPFLWRSTVLVTNSDGSWGKLQDVPLCTVPQMMGKKGGKKGEKAKLESLVWTVRPYTMGWPCHSAVSEHRSQLSPSFPETASCSVLHVPWDLTACLLISRHVCWGKIIAFTGEISLCSSWIVEELEGTPVTGNDVMSFRRRWYRDVCHPVIQRKDFHYKLQKK